MDSDYNRIGQTTGMIRPQHAEKPSSNLKSIIASVAIGVLTTLGTAIALFAAGAAIAPIAAISLPAGILIGGVTYLVMKFFISKSKSPDSNTQGSSQNRQAQPAQVQIKEENNPLENKPLKNLTPVEEAEWEISMLQSSNQKMEQAIKAIPDSKIYRNNIPAQNEAIQTFRNSIEMNNSSIESIKNGLEARIKLAALMNGNY